MKDYQETLYYSASQSQKMKRAGVVLLDGEDKPFLSTETITNMLQRDPFGSGMRDEEPPSLKSGWKDAIQIYSGNGEGYQRLLNGAGEVTALGKSWCAAHGVEPRPETLLAVATVPPARLRILKPFSLRGK